MENNYSELIGKMVNLLFVIGDKEYEAIAVYLGPTYNGLHFSTRPKAGTFTIQPGWLHSMHEAIGTDPMAPRKRRVA